MKKLERLNQIKNLWEEGQGVTEISKKINLSSSNVSNYLNVLYGKGKRDRFIYTRRVYFIDEGFFNKIDSSAKSYFFGLLSADGNITKNTIRISLHEKDKDILELFRKELQYEFPLQKIIKKKENGWNRSNQYLLQINSKGMTRDLIKHGLSTNKSLTLDFSQSIDNDLINDYIRGYFDGDGCIHIRKDNTAEVSIAGSKKFCEKLSEYLSNVNISAKTSKHSKNNCYYTRIRGANNIKKFYDFLYGEKCTLYIKRKKEIFETWLIKKTENDNREKENIAHTRRDSQKDNRL